MGTGRFKRILLVSICLFSLAIPSACSGQTIVTPFVPPTSPNIPVLAPSTQPAPQSRGLSPTLECSDGLYFLQDLTIPDNSAVAPGSLLDKTWLVQNNGSCNWDNRYRLRLIGGEALGATTEQALYPARSGTQAVIRIVFTAPSSYGNYYSEWRAYDPQGIPFGDSFFIKITVSP